MKMFSLGWGIGTKNQANEWLEVFFAAPLLNPEASVIKSVTSVIGEITENTSVELSSEQLKQLSQQLQQNDQAELAKIAARMANSAQPAIICALVEDSAPASAVEVYLKLHLLSHRLVKPHHTKLDGMFGLLVNTAWTSEGAIDARELADRQLQARLEGRVLEVKSVDKFPSMADYVVPSGIRIGDAQRVRLGAYLGEGTTIMHEGFVNFNAGTEGTSMIEGRISAGVTVAKGSDLGGGCSTMGTLSGGGKEVITVGTESLIGANAGLGIPLGDRCTIESGLYLTAGAKVNLLDDKGQLVEVVKARALSGLNDLLFRRNSLSGALEAKANKNAVELNHELHAHN